LFFVVLSCAIYGVERGEGEKEKGHRGEAERKRRGRMDKCDRILNYVSFNSLIHQRKKKGKNILEKGGRESKTNLSFQSSCR